MASLEAPNVQILGVFAIHLKKSVPEPDRLTNWLANLEVANLVGDARLQKVRILDRGRLFLLCVTCRTTDPR